MSKPTEGEPVFSSASPGHLGLSERRYYIGQALAGICANPNLSQASYSDTALIAITQADEIMKFLYPQPEKETEQ